VCVCGVFVCVCGVWCVCVWCVCMCARVPCIAMEGKLLIIDIQLNLVSARFEYRLGHHAS